MMKTEAETEEGETEGWAGEWLSLTLGQRIGRISFALLPIKRGRFCAQD